MFVQILPYEQQELNLLQGSADQDNQMEEIKWSLFFIIVLRMVYSVLPFELQCSAY